MSGWSDFTSFAKSTLTNAQKQIDKALDIKDAPVGAGKCASCFSTNMV